MPRLHSGTASDRPEITKKSKLPPIPEVVWQQPTENVTKQDNLNNINKDCTLKTNVANKHRHLRETNHRVTWIPRNDLQEIKQGMR